jgi:hypothetical protein
MSLATVRLIILLCKISCVNLSRYNGPNFIGYTMPDTPLICVNKYISCPACNGHKFSYEREPLTNRVVVFCRSTSPEFQDGCEYVSNFHKPWRCTWDAGAISCAHQFEDKIRIHNEQFVKKESDPKARAS